MVITVVGGKNVLFFFHYCTFFPQDIENKCLGEKKNEM